MIGPKLVIPSCPHCEGKGHLMRSPILNGAEVAEFMRRVRELKGVRLVDLAKAMGAAPALVCNLEGNKRPFTERLYARWAKALGVEVQ